MPAPYSMDLRERVIKLHYAMVHSNQKIANILLISLSTVKRYIKQYQTKHNLESKLSPGRTPKLTDDELGLVCNIIEDNSDATLKWFCDEIDRKFLKIISKSTMALIIKKLGYTRKKRVYMQRNKIQIEFSS